MPLPLIYTTLYFYCLNLNSQIHFKFVNYSNEKIIYSVRNGRSFRINI